MAMRIRVPYCTATIPIWPIKIELRPMIATIPPAHQRACLFDICGSSLSSKINERSVKQIVYDTFELLIITGNSSTIVQEKVVEPIEE